jgi:hypothetical protein
MAAREKATSGEGERCYHCDEPIDDDDRVLLVSTSDGRRLALHAPCFIETTFDPASFTVATG